MNRKTVCYILTLSMIAMMLFPALSCAQEKASVTVICSFYPLRIFAMNVLEGVPDVQLETLAPAGTGCLHDFQLMTGDLKKLEGAACLVINGAGMEQNFLPLLTREHNDLPLVDCSTGIELMQDEEGDNPHIWLSPALAARMVENMANGLADILPQYAETILENGSRYSEKLIALGAEMRSALEGCAGRSIVTFHEAFPYFAEVVGLKVLTSVTVEPDETPSPRMIAQTVALIREAGGCPLFSEPGVPSDALTAVSRETGCPVYELDPITDGAFAPDAYEAAMRKNLAVLKNAFGI